MPTTSPAASSPLISRTTQKRRPQAWRNATRVPSKASSRARTMKAPSFLSLPPEIRNHIYRHALVFPSDFQIQLKSYIGVTNLLCTNKQIAAEATEMFYHENTFVIPEAVLTSQIAPLEQLEASYGLPRWRLARLRKIKVEVPVLGPQRDQRSRNLAAGNLDSLAFFLTRHGQAELKIGFRYRIDGREDEAKVTPGYYRDLLAGPLMLHRAKRDVALVLQAHPRVAHEMNEIVERLFPDRAAILVNVSQNLPAQEVLERRMWLRQYAHDWEGLPLRDGEKDAGMERITELIMYEGNRALMAWAYGTRSSERKDSQNWQDV